LLVARKVRGGAARVASAVAHLRRAELSWEARLPRTSAAQFGVIKSFSPTAN